MFRKFRIPGFVLAIILVIGTAGYRLIGGSGTSLVDALYMTVITVATIGYGEIIDLSGNPGGRIFTMLIAVSGIGVLAYMLTSFTALVVEGELTRSFRRSRMEKMAHSYRGHYIVCGAGLVGAHIIKELRDTKRLLVIVEGRGHEIERPREVFQDDVVIEGDADDDDLLRQAGIENARGLFAVTGDDNLNLVVSLTAKQLNPGIRVVAQCNEIKNVDKLKRAGADAVVSPNFIGGLRMASEMVRPTVVSFLDTMLRDKEKNLRVEEIQVAGPFVGKAISALDLKKYPHTLLLALKTKDDWIYNPPESHVIGPHDILVIMTTPEDLGELSRVLQRI